MLHAVAAGHGITFITEGKAGALHVPGVVTRRLADPVPTVPIALAWHRGNRDPALLRLVAHARGMAAAGSA